jgi:hypothetical protein
MPKNEITGFLDAILNDDSKYPVMGLTKYKIIPIRNWECTKYAVNCRVNLSNFVNAFFEYHPLIPRKMEYRSDIRTNHLKIECNERIS